MSWRSSLPDQGREIVEDCTRKMEGRNWRQRRDVLEEALERTYQAQSGNAGVLDAAARQQSASIMVAAVLEKLDATDIVDGDQAQLFAMSADAGHQVAACDWFIHRSMALPAPGTPETLH